MSSSKSITTKVHLPEYLHYRGKVQTPEITGGENTFIYR